MLRDKVPSLTQPHPALPTGPVNPPQTSLRPVYLPSFECTMSDSSSAAAMKKGGSTALAGGRAQSGEGFPGSCRFETVLSAECSTWPSADWSIFKDKSLQTPESLFLFAAKGIFTWFSKTTFHKLVNIQRKAKFEACTNVSRCNMGRTLQTSTFVSS